MKIRNRNPYFGAARRRHVVRGCGEESQVFGMLTPRAWAEAQKVFDRNPEDLPPDWPPPPEAPSAPEGLRDPESTPKPPSLIVRFIDGPALTAILIAILGAMIGLLLMSLFAPVRVVRPDPSLPALQPTVVHVGESALARSGPVVVVDEPSGAKFDVPAGAALGLPELDASLPTPPSSATHFRGE